ncbi:MAG TPA: DinB family protein [Thermoanaerobaculia bacterium]|nr:DinB family protein [Thermoanaerobaculia bacterium]
MTSEQVVARFDRTTTDWLDSLGRYCDDDLRRPGPDPEGWNLGQVYSHIIEATESLAIPSIRKCLDPERKSSPGSMNIAGRLIFFIGSFPPVRIRFKPRPDYVPSDITVDDAKAGLIRTRDAIRSISGSIEKADPLRRARHPAFGPLNAQQWLLFAEMHLRHHLRQKRRIDKALHSGN